MAEPAPARRSHRVAIAVVGCSDQPPQTARVPSNADLTPGTRGRKAVQAALQLDTPTAKRTRLFEDPELRVALTSAQLASPGSLKELPHKTDDGEPLVFAKPPSPPRRSGGDIAQAGSASGSGRCNGSGRRTGSGRSGADSSGGAAAGSSGGSGTRKNRPPPLPKGLQALVRGGVFNVLPRVTEEGDTRGMLLTAEAKTPSQEGYWHKAVKQLIDHILSVAAEKNITGITESQVRSAINSCIRSFNNHFREFTDNPAKTFDELPDVHKQFYQAWVDKYKKLWEADTLPMGDPHLGTAAPRPEGGQRRRRTSHRPGRSDRRRSRSRSPPRARSDRRRSRSRSPARARSASRSRSRSRTDMRASPGHGGLGPIKDTMLAAARTLPPAVASVLQQLSERRAKASAAKPAPREQPGAPPPPVEQRQQSSRGRTIQRPGNDYSRAGYVNAPACETAGAFTATQQQTDTNPARRQRRATGAGGSRSQQQERAAGSAGARGAGADGPGSGRARAGDGGEASSQQYVSEGSASSGETEESEEDTSDESEE